jgi:hypothetical protein
MFLFNIRYFILFSFIFCVETFIALYITQPFVRHFLGDVLVVILIYAFIKSFINITVIKASIYVVIFSYLIELFQYYNGIEILGLQDNTLARIVLGTTFTYTDLLAYTIGGVLIIITKNLGCKK